VHQGQHSRQVFCQECGHNVGDAKFCGECGTKIASSTPAAASSTMAAAKETFQDPHAGQHGGEKLLGGNTKGSGIVGAVRQYTADATTAEKEKKYGQQKWGLFETNYQRTKGITTEQSLQELENAATHGVSYTVKSGSSSGGTAGSDGSSSSSSSGGGGSSSPGGSFGGSSSSSSAGGAAGQLNPGKFGSSTGGAAANIKGTASFGQGGSMADKFLAGHLAKEKAKFAPKRNL